MKRLEGDCKRMMMVRVRISLPQALRDEPHLYAYACTCTCAQEGRDLYAYACTCTCAHPGDVDPARREEGRDLVNVAITRDDVRRVACREGGEVSVDRLDACMYAYACTCIPVPID